MKGVEILMNPIQFDLEDKIRWEELAPSLQNRFKNLEDNLNKLAKEVDMIRGAAFKSWSLKHWETSHVFKDLDFYELLDVTQSGSNNKISSKTYNCLFGYMKSDYNRTDKVSVNGHPMWIKHQQNFTLPDGTTRIFLGAKAATSGTEIYMSDADGLNFKRVGANLGGVAVWDMAEWKADGQDNALFILIWNGSGSGSTVYRTVDGISFTAVASIGGNYTKTICKFKNQLVCVASGATYFTNDGINWTSKSNNISADQIYSRYYINNTIYIGSESPGAVWVSTDAVNFTKIWTGTEAYTRWICSWKPTNYYPNTNDRLIIWGTGGTGTEVGGARLMCYDPKDSSNPCGEGSHIFTLFDFRGDNGGGNDKLKSLNYGHAPIEPLIVKTPGSAAVTDTSGAVITPATPATYEYSGFRERQIRYIEVFENDYSGESFILMGTSDSHFYNDLKDKQLYYGEFDYVNSTYNTSDASSSNRIFKPILDDDGNMIKWSDTDKEAWMTDGDAAVGGQSVATYMGNVYYIGPRNPQDATFNKWDLCVGLIKHTEDTRVYSMNIFTDTKNVKWAYAGTGGGNYSGRGLLYRFGYSDVLNIVEATKIGAIFPPRWKVDGTLNKRIEQCGTRHHIKIMSGVSGRDDFAELKFAISKNNNMALKSGEAQPYYKLIFNHEGTDSYYAIRLLPNYNSSSSVIKGRLEFISVIGNIETILHTIDLPDGYLETWQSGEMIEGSDSPYMGPYYIMAGCVTEGALNPNSTSSVDTYLYNDMDGSVKFYFKKSTDRSDIVTDSNNDYMLEHVINYSGGERKKIGNYGIESYDAKGMMLISIKQQSLAKHNKDALEVGEIVFAVK